MVAEDRKRKKSSKEKVRGEKGKAGRKCPDKRCKEGKREK